MFVESLNRLLIRLSGRRRYAHFKRIQGVPYLPAEEIARIQIDKLRTLLQRAQADVPYYAEVMKRSGFRPDRLDSVEQLQDLPILTKGIICERFDDLISRAFDKRDLLLASTGGSTGEPINFYKDLDCHELEMALMWRSWAWAGWRPGDRMVWVWGAPQETSQLNSLKGRVKWRLGGKLLLDAYDLSDAKMIRWVDLINRFGAEHMMGYVSSFMYFGKFLLDRGIELKPRIKQIITTADKLYPNQREFIEKAFGTRVKDHYGCREIRMISFEGPTGDMHISTDAVVVEFIEDPKVHTGGYQIFATALDNFAMPLIRYEVGDYGAPEDRESESNINFPLMKVDIGRTMDNFLTPSGKVVYGQYFVLMVHDMPGVHKFQFYQKECNLITLSIVLEEGCRPPDMEEKMQGVVQKVKALDVDLDIDIKFVDHIDLTKTGKHRFMVSELCRS